MGYLTGLAEGPRLPLLPFLLSLGIAAVFAAAWYLSDPGYLVMEMSRWQVIGTSLMFTIMPGYIFLMMLVQIRRTRQTLVELEPISSAELRAPVLERMQGFGPYVVFIMLAGALFGVVQNWGLVARMLRTGAVPMLDLVFVLANALVWTFVALILSWRIPVSRQLSALGRQITVDLYRVEQVRPLARLATTDVLVVAGALAFMPLQALDAQFRLGNYQFGIMVGVPAAVLLFLLPLWGVRDRIKQAKAQRVAELNEQIEKHDRFNVEGLEALLAHRDRVRAVANWPLDLQLLTRIFAYVVIPPLAWIAAALVENAIDNI